MHKVVTIERIWRLSDAKSKFSELVARARDGEAQVVTKRGKRVAILISAEEYAHLLGKSSRRAIDFVQHLLAAPKGDFTVPRRSKWKPRQAD
jgi:prevent-host-death family protein